MKTGTLHSGGTRQHANDLDRARDALFSIPADLPRDEWHKVGRAAIAAGLDIDALIDWSRNAPNFKSEPDVRSAFKTITPEGGTGPGTLYRIAVDHGYRNDGGRTAPRLTPTPRKAAEPPRKPAPGMSPGEVWARGLPATNEHPYIVKKQAAGVPLDTLRVLPANDPLVIGGESMAGALVVPAYAPDGTLQSTQLVSTTGKKMNLPGSPMAGGMFTVSTIEPGKTVYIVEGIGQACAVWQATGCAAVVAFGWGNVAKVASALRQRDPSARLVICPDVGKEGAAELIAREFDAAVAAMPECWPNNSDVNDLAQRDGFDVLELLLERASKPSMNNPQDAIRDVIGNATRYTPNDSQSKVDAAITPGDSPNWQSRLYNDQAHEERLARLNAAHEVVRQVIEASAKDPNAYLTGTSIEAFATVKDADLLDYEAARTSLRMANTKIRASVLDKFVAKQSKQNGGSSGSGGNSSGGNEATTLADLAAERSELWRDPDQNTYATIEREFEGEKHFEHWLLNSDGFKEWMSWLAHSELGKAPSSETLSSSRNALHGKAKFDGDEHSVFKRIGKDESGYWIDLCDPEWRAILVTPTGWEIKNNPPIRFIRTKAMRPLPTPIAGGDYTALWPLINIPEADRPLVLGWILETYRCDTPFAVLELIGEQGSAKSSTQEKIRALTDPNQVALRGSPKTVEDVNVAARNSHMISLENLSGISPDISDALCTVATGGGAAGRTLYTNGEESVIEVHNPIILNGISAVITRHDLLDRAISLCLPTIERRELVSGVEGLNARFERSAPSIFGGLLDLLSKTLTRISDVDIAPEHLPRMADFAILGEAMHRTNGFENGAWLDQYTNHRRDAIRRIVEASPVAAQCMAFVEAGQIHNGTVKELFERLNLLFEDQRVERGDYWPKSPKGLADALRRAAPALRQLGIHVIVHSKPTRLGVICELRRADKRPDSPSPHGVGKFKSSAVDEGMEVFEL